VGHQHWSNPPYAEKIYCYAGPAAVAVAGLIDHGILPAARVEQKFLLQATGRWPGPEIDEKRQKIEHRAADEIAWDQARSAEAAQ
jgi:hypothetical protein